MKRFEDKVIDHRCKDDYKDSDDYSRFDVLGPYKNFKGSTVNLIQMRGNGLYRCDNGGEHVITALDGDISLMVTHPEHEEEVHIPKFHSLHLGNDVYFVAVRNKKSELVYLLHLSTKVKPTLNVEGYQLSEHDHYTKIEKVIVTEIKKEIKPRIQPKDMGRNGVLFGVKDDFWIKEDKADGMSIGFNGKFYTYCNLSYTMEIRA
tara:strand:- start:1204 stop:1815 length:612 start_codon:yes stop_codon:yes gene_type:complete